ncbi:hypothetical protein [Muriicola jejuensis]|uniref:HTTM domain-containing protein n=1 Tax=Muriicola jejuensis TaxID=504488 RepID=A0A6P0UDH3_9FLAO|nr:hypothetical protein [Muriicola jejuensis]NER11321.1 hypothetical protein [Muriicola jejuensis]
MISIQICVVYFHSAIAKFGVEEWRNGTAVYYWATHNIFGVNTSFISAVRDLLAMKLVVMLLTWGALFLEILFFGWIFIRSNKWNWLLFLLMGFSFHFLIIFFHGLFSFFFSMLGAIILYYIPKHKNFNLKFSCHE